MRFELNSMVVDGDVTEIGRGLRVRLSRDDWNGLGVSPGQSVQVRVHDRLDERLVVAEIVEGPACVWMTLTKRICEVESRWGRIIIERWDEPWLESGELELVACQ